MTRLTALLAGATGLVGGECLRALLASRTYEQVVVMTRRELGPAGQHRKVQQLIVDFASLDEQREQLRADHVFCALGTTIAKAGTREKFREVDYEYPRRLAELTRHNEARHFSLVSALGANAGAPFFYSRVKGELEEALRHMAWPSLAIFRPSVIKGDRRESRPLERLAERALSLAPTTWRPVAAADIAQAMVRTAGRAPAGVTIIESRNILSAARSNQS